MQKKTKEQFIKEAREVYGNQFDYSESIYKGSLYPISYKCNKCGFTNTINQSIKHILEKTGCRICGECRLPKNTNTETFLYKLFYKFPEIKKYDFSKFEYVNSHKKSIVICEKHGEFKISPNGLLNSRGCRKCYNERASIFRRSTKEQFIEKATNIHGNKYDYSKVEYKTSNDKVTIICKTHGEFKQTPDNHLSGNGCSKCASSFLSRENLKTHAILYYVKIQANDKEYYKIGFTTKSIKERFRKDKSVKITPIKIWKYDIGGEAYKKEQELLVEYSDFLTDDKVIKVGNSEVFDDDILGLDILCL